MRLILNKLNIRTIHFITLIIPAIFIISSCSPYSHSVKNSGTQDQSDLIYNVLEENYPFSKHKDISLKELSSELSLLSENLDSPTGNYLKAREFIYRLPDSRMNLVSNQDKKLKKKETSGYIGFDIASTDDGKFIVCRIDSQSQAWERGLRPGFEIIGWNQKHISEYITEFPLRWGYHPATEQARRILSCHYISMGEPGTSAEVFYINDQNNNKGIRLEYNRKDSDATPFYTGVIDPNKGKGGWVIRMMADGTVYYRVDHFTPAAYRHFRKEVLPVLKNSKGLVIDLRDNQGGYDPIAAKIAGHLVSLHGVYEEAFIREGDNILTIGEIHVHPEATVYNKNIIILTGPFTMGVGEGFARILQKDEHVRLLGSWNTAGSFSLAGGRLKLGNGLEFHYPIGGAMDENHKIIIEAGVRHQGLKPDILIPLSKDAFLLMNGGFDILLEEAVHRIR